MFGIGDLAVYPGYGVGKIVDIETKEICGSMTEFLAIELIENGSKLFVPKAAAKSKGLRPIIGEDEVENGRAYLADRVDFGAPGPDGFPHADRPDGAETPCPDRPRRLLPDGARARSGLASASLAPY